MAEPIHPTMNPDVWGDGIYHGQDLPLGATFTEHPLVHTPRCMASPECGEVAEFRVGYIDLKFKLITYGAASCESHLGFTLVDFSNMARVSINDLWIARTSMERSQRRGEEKVEMIKVGSPAFAALRLMMASRPAS